MQKIFAPHLNHHIRVGGRRRPHNMHLYAPRASSYLAPHLIDAPVETNYRAKFDPALAQVFENDTLGCCVIAARYHRIGQLTALAGKGFVASNAQIITDYQRVGGYRGTEATDNGCDMVTNNNDGVTHGYADGSKDAGWLVVDGTDQQQMKQVIYLFEGSVDLGIELPDAWLSPFPEKNGFVWDVAGEPNPANGHCIQAIDYNAQGIIVATWGLWGIVTWAAAKKYLARSAFGETYLHINKDQVASVNAKSPNGFDWATLVADFDELGGTVPAPIPNPAPAPAPPAPAPAPPAPAPTPKEAITLAAAQELVTAGFKSKRGPFTKREAEQIANAALTKGWY